MAKALASQWPETHATKQLNEVFGWYKTFATNFSSCVYDHDYEDDFFRCMG